MELIFYLGILVFSVVIHEVSHGVVAYSLGDPTAKNMGRLTLNPIPHIDPLGSVILPFLLIMSGGPVFGWAKPVPINPFNFKDQTWGSLKVALAGPISNFAVAIAFSLVLRFMPFSILGDSVFPSLLVKIVFLNILLGVFNLFPFPPLDGSHVFFSFLPSFFDPLKNMLTQYGFFILLFLILFFEPFASFLSFFVNRLMNLFLGA